jgi:hypothetical protein
MAHKKLAVLAAALLSGAMIEARAQSPEFSFSLGAEYTTGEYDLGRDTDIWYFPATFQYDADSFRVSITAPLIFVDGPGAVVGSGDARGIFGPGESNDAEIGAGDILLKASFNLARESADGPRMDVTGTIKFGTGDVEKNLGTGEDDYSVQLDVERNFDPTGVFASIGYKVLGDPPGVDYDNVIFGNAGAMFRASDTASVGAVLHFQEEVLSRAPSQRDLTLFMNAQVDAKRELTGYVLKGLRDGSPDWGIGVQMKFYQ